MGVHLEVTTRPAVERQWKLGEGLPDRRRLGTRSRRDEQPGTAHERERHEEWPPLHGRVSAPLSGPRQLVGKPGQDVAAGEQHQERDQEHDPAREGMVEALGHLAAEVVGEKARAADAEGVRRDRDRYRDEQQRPALPGRLLGEVAVHRAEGEEGLQRTDAAAGLGHLERGVGQRDHVPLAQDGNAAGLQAERGRLGGEQLERERDRVHHDRGQRHHEEQEREREGQRPQPRRAEDQPDEARYYDDQRAALEVQISTQHAQHEHQEAEDENACSREGSA